jgi:hypothetical protein
MVFGKQKYIFPIENNHANNAYHPSANPVCDGFLALLDDIVTLGFFARKVIEKRGHQINSSKHLSVTLCAL